LTPPCSVVIENITAIFALVCIARAFCAPPAGFLSA
jgi:hypothetical protein